jgi:hypothetical protein
MNEQRYTAMWCILLLLLLVCINGVHSQSFQWNRTAAVTGDVNVLQIRTDGDDNVYIGGTYTTKVINLGTTACTVTNSKDLKRSKLFIAKLNTQQVCQWIISVSDTASSANGDVFFGDFRVSSSYVYFIGSFDGPQITVGSKKISNADTLIEDSYHSTDVFLFKYNLAGVYQWAANAGGSDDFADNNGVTITVSSDDSFVYISGYYSSKTMVFSSATTNSKPQKTISRTSSSSLQKYIWYAQYSSAGSVQWAYSQGSEGRKINIQNFELSSDDNFLFMNGLASSSVTLKSADSSTVTVSIIDYFSSYTSFIAKMTITGNFLWVKSYAAEDLLKGDYSKRMILRQNYIYLVGISQGFIDFQSGWRWAPLYDTTDVYIAKLHQSNGTTVWSNMAIGNAVKTNIGIAFSKDEDTIWISGSFTGKLAVTYYSNLNRVTKNSNDLFLLAYSRLDGRYLWSTAQNGSSSYTVLSHMALTGSGINEMAYVTEYAPVSNGYLFNTARPNICYGISSLNFSSVCSGKGSCMADNECHCISNYTGSICNIPICFGILANDSSVCSGRGDCLLANNCTCDNAYYGEECQNHTCFNILSNDTHHVCSGHGDCVAGNECMCSSNYANLQCQDWYCNGTLNTAPKVCSGHGICNASDSCACHFRYGGSYCSELVGCIGLCQNGATCVKGNCSCSNDFYGDVCNITTCYSIASDMSSVCSGHGACTSKNNCSCTNGYSGNQCQVARSCFGIAFNNASVCNKHGNCTEQDTCVCNYGYYPSNNCSLIAKCGGVPHNSNTTCSGHGTCNTYGLEGNTSCSCSKGYGGEFCEQSVCNNLLSTLDSVTVCSGHGVCKAPNVCNCSYGYSDIFCNKTMECYNVTFNNNSVCSSRGSCIGLNNCQCQTGYIHDCSIPLCFNVSRDNSSTCSSHGTCLDKDNCNCTEGYSGQNCEVTRQCFNKMFTNVNVCSGHGNCFSQDSCSCSNEYYGNNCQVFCDSSVNCSSNGNCSSDGSTCVCDNEHYGTDCSKKHSICFGIRDIDSNVCNGHGNCTADDTCACEYGHYPHNNCSLIAECYSVVYNSNSACSGNGTCVVHGTDGNTTCSCHNGYGGTQCNEFVCDSLLSNSDSQRICSGHGVCAGAEICKCIDGYTGTYCQYSECHSIIETNTSVCSGHGNCTAPDTCHCIENNWTGDKCEIPICFNITGNDGNVCMGHGSCVLSDVCNCNANYYGPQCQHYICNGVNHDNSSVCSGRGGCTDVNTCNCSSGYAGDNCEISFCYGYNQTQEQVCSNHGSCIDSDVCDCIANEWTGSNCDIPICFGVSSNDTTRVCSKHGECVAVNDCHCSAGWIGEQCEIPICFSIAANESLVCSGHGNCTNVDTCVCDKHFEDSQCNIGICGNIRADNTSVCNHHGTCGDNTPICECDSGYSGDICDKISCFGIESTNNSTCSAHGDCIGPDECHCYNNCYGANCQVSVCYGGFSNESSVCSSHGACVEYNKCECDIHYYGDNCEAFDCDNVSYLNDTVCHSRGQCIDYNICECHNSSYSGEFCEYITCFGVAQNETESVCSGHGSCEDIQFCQCHGEYYGDNCEQFDCYGVDIYNTSVCNSHGSCTDLDTCSCDERVSGTHCDIYECFGTNSTESTVCNSYGSCIDVDTCECEAGRGGVQCELTDFNCFGTQFNSSNVCSKHGECITTDKCKCNNGWAGDQCDTPTCESKHDTSDTCSGHGDCVAPDNCQCNWNIELGYWIGSTCNECHENFVGSYCNDSICTDETTCNGHGVCYGGFCTCHKDDTNGYWSGDNCEVCTTHYYGRTCATKCEDSKCVTNFDDPFVFTGTGALVGRFDSSESNTKLSEAYSCRDIVHSSTLSKLGSGPICSWIYFNRTDSIVLEITFGFNPSLSPGDTILLNLLYSDTTQVPSYVEIRTTIPPIEWIPSKPIANILSSSTISSCSDLVLNGKLSFSYDEKDLKYQWSCTSGENSEAINSYLQSQTQSGVTIPSVLMTKQDSIYSFSLIVTSIFNATSLPAIRNVKKLADGVPSITIVGGGTYQIGDAFRVTGSITKTTCNPDTSSFIFNWIQISGPKALTLKTVGSTSSSSVTFRSNDFDTTGTYTFQLSISTATKNNITSQDFTLVMQYPSLIALIGGGDIVGTNAVIISVSSKCTDPAASSETEITQWTCTKKDGTNVPLANSNSKTLTIPSKFFPTGEYTITLTCLKGMRNATASIHANISDDPKIPAVALGPVNNLINSNEKLSLAVTSAQVSGKGTLSGVWSVTSSVNGDVTSSILTASQLTVKAVSIAAGKLKEGESYTFRYSVTNEGLTGYAEVTCYVNKNPVPGRFLVSPTSGTEATTPISITFSGWTDTDLPLVYTYSYLDIKNTIQPLYTTRDIDPTYTTKYIPVVNSNGTVVIVGTVKDALGGSYSVQQTIQVLPLTNSEKQEASKDQVSHLDDLLNSGSVSDALSIIVSVGSMMSGTTTSSEKIQLVSKMMDTISSLVQSEDVQKQFALVVNALYLAAFDPYALTTNVQKSLQSSLSTTVNVLPDNVDSDVYSKLADTFSNGILAKQNLSTTDAKSVEVSTLDSLMVIGGKMSNGDTVNSQAFGMNAASLEQTSGGTYIEATTETGASALIPDAVYQKLGNPEFIAVVIMTIYSNFLSSGMENTSRRRVFSVTKMSFNQIHISAKPAPKIEFVPSDSVTALIIYDENKQVVTNAFDEPMLIEVPYHNVTYFSRLSLWKELTCSQYNRTSGMWHQTNCTVHELREDSVVCSCYTSGLTKVDTIPLDDQLETDNNRPTRLGLGIGLGVGIPVVTIVLLSIIIVTIIGAVAVFCRSRKPEQNNIQYQKEIEVEMQNI